MYTLKAVLVHLLNLWLTIFNDVKQLKPPGSFKSPEIIIELMPNEINTYTATSKATGIDGLSVKFLKL